MKNLAISDLEVVSGGEVTWSLNVGFFEISGNGSDLAAGYYWAVDQMSDFFTWWDPAGYYEGC